jgi:hypothetical protein
LRPKIPASAAFRFLRMEQGSIAKIIESVHGNLGNWTVRATGGVIQVVPARLL